MSLPGESDLVAYNRSNRKQQFDLAERLLELGLAAVNSVRVRLPGGDLVATQIITGLYAKVLNSLASIIILQERGLPTAAVMREMTEALINLAYIATDPLPRAQLYVDGTWLRRQRDINRRRNSQDPEIRGNVTQHEMDVIGQQLDEIERRRGAEVVKQMQDRRLWRSWAGPTIERMVWEAKLPAAVYEEAYSMDSAAVHGMDAISFLDLEEDGHITVLVATGRTAKHLTPAIVVAVYAFAIVNRIFQLKQEHIILDLRERAKNLAGMDLSAL